MNKIKWDKKESQNKEAKYALPSYSLESGYIIFTDEFLFVDHLTGGDDLSHDNKQVSSDHVIFAECIGSTRGEIGQADNCKTDDDEANPKPFDKSKLTVEECNTEKTGEYDDSATKHLEG